MHKKFNIIIPKMGIILSVILLIIATPMLVFNSVFAKGQDTCPDNGNWVKVDGLSGKSYTYTALEGYLVAETCYKAGATLVNGTINPPQKTVTLKSTVQNPNENNYQDISHASFRLVNEPTPTPTDEFTPTPTDEFTPTPTDEFTPTPTDEFTPTPTDEFTPTPTDEFTPTPTDEFTPTPTDEFTPTPTDEFTPTPTDEFTPTPTDEFTPTPTDEFTPTPTDEIEFVPLTVIGFCKYPVASISAAQSEETIISWSVSNSNDEIIPFKWTANNGQSGTGTVLAIDNTNFITRIDGLGVTLDYSFNEEAKTSQALIDSCETQQETEEPTPTPTDEVTPTPTVEFTPTPTVETTPTVDPTSAPTDSQPDQPAGGSGPSLGNIFLSFMIGAGSIAVFSTILVKNKKVIIP